MMNNSSSTIAVVGGGLGGLAAACTLAARGHKVTLFERNSWVGGKAAEHRQDGYRFDMGPTIVTIPSVLRRIFEEADRKLEDYLDMRDLDPQWRCFFQDGEKLDLYKDNEQMLPEIDAFTGNTEISKNYAEFLEWSKTLNDISHRIFFYKPVGGMKDLFKFSSMFDRKMLKDVLAMRLGTSLGKSIRDKVPDTRVAQMIDHFAQYVGSSPDASPAILAGIAHMQTSEGISYPIGGTRAVPVALEKLGRELGVEYRTEAMVEEITHHAGKVTGIRLADGEYFECDGAVSNCDSVRTFQELLKDTPPSKLDHPEKFEPACSGVVLYLGLNKKYDHIAHHNFVFSRDPHEEFEAIYDQGEPAPDPTCYVCAPSLTEPDVAPAGGEALYVLVHTPYLREHHDWKKMFPAYRQKILDKLKTTGKMPDIEERIVTEHHLTPQDIHERYHVLDGAIYGLASHGVFNGAFKPNNRRKELSGLYLCGGAAHPGPGMPMVLMSGWIAGDALDEDSKAPAA